MLDEKIIIHELTGQETFFEIIYKLYPEIQSEVQLRTLYSAISILNKDINEFDYYNGESFLNPDKILSNNSYLLLPSHGSLLYAAIFGYSTVDSILVAEIANNMNKSYVIFSSLKYAEKVNQKINKLGAIDSIGVTNAMTHLVKQLNNKDYLKQKHSENQTSENEKSAFDEFTDGLSDEYNTKNISIETGKNLLEALGKTAVGITERIRDIDYLILEYATTKNRKNKIILKALILDKHAQLKRLLPGFVNKHIKTNALNTNSTKPKAGSRALDNINRTIKNYKVKAQDTKRIQEALKGFGLNEVKLKDGNIFERFKADTERKNFLKKAGNPHLKKMPITTSELRGHLIWMARGNLIASAGLLLFDMGMGTNEVLEAAEKGENWERKVFEVAGGIGFGYAVGEFYSSVVHIATTAIPGGLIIKIPLHLLGIPISIAAGYVGSSGFGEIYDFIHPNKTPSNITNEDKEWINELRFIHVPLN